ncbi:MAG: hypothetical protein JEZ07_09850 [Phycisphaerae bacterium]|nr:hypothetical protein [Phycisphaerae bacterium]
MTRVIWLLVIFVSLTGCKQGQVGRPPRVENPATAGEFYVLREKTSMGAALPYTIGIDHQDYVVLTSGSYTNIQLDSGSHVLTVKYPRQAFLGTAEASMEFECEPNKKAYVLVGPKTMGGVKFGILPEGGGSVRAKSYKYIEVK